MTLTELTDVMAGLGATEAYKFGRRRFIDDAFDGQSCQ